MYTLGRGIVPGGTDLYLRFQVEVMPASQSPPLRGAPFQRGQAACGRDEGWAALLRRAPQAAKPLAPFGKGGAPVRTLGWGIVLGAYLLFQIPNRSNAAKQFPQFRGEPFPRGSLGPPIEAQSQLETIGEGNAVGGIQQIGNFSGQVTAREEGEALRKQFCVLGKCLKVQMSAIYFVIEEIFQLFIHYLSPH